MDYFTLKEYVDILSNAGQLVESNISEFENTIVKDLTFNSQTINDGSLFVCKGATFKESYLTSALEKGAVAYVSEQQYTTENPYIIVQDIRIVMPILAHHFFNNPTSKLNLIGVGGTKGKSTASYYIKAIIDDYLKASNKCESAIISSVDTYDGVDRFESHITTPESIDLHRHITNAVNSNIEFLEMEVSSQALKYNRVDKITFDVGIFLNISEDHISPIEHPDFEDYFSSKLRMFGFTKNALICTNTNYWEDVLEAAQNSENIITFGTKAGSDIYGYNIRKENNETVFNVKCDKFEQEFRLTMPGLFNVENALAAIATAYVYNIPTEYIYSGLYRARSAGRMESFTGKDKSIIAIVDYAHNKLSFDALFESTSKEYPDYDIISIFGCPGGKAFIRRRDLGTIAGMYSKKIYLVAEDPGPEPAEQISKEIAKYVEAEGCPYEIIEERGDAILKAISEATPNTVILITGKGNETRQKYGKEYLPCKSDIEYVKEAFA